MWTRGLFNIYVHGRWYRSYHPRARIRSPDEPGAVAKILQILEETPESGGWEAVPFPSPLSRSVNVVYTINRDALTLVICRWGEFEGAVRPEFKHMNLDIVYSLSDGIPNRGYEPQAAKLLSKTQGESPPQSVISGTLDINFKPPTPLNELQQRLFTDFVFQWQFYIDDHSLWQYPSPLFNTLAIAILRLASWDFEVLLDGNEVELPINFRSVPCWKFPETHTFWFHGFLVVLCDSLHDKVSVTAAVLMGRSFLREYPSSSLISRLILISLRDVAFVELSSEQILCSTILPLVMNSSALHCSPGFRALTYVLSTNCWKVQSSHSEKWGFSLPLDIFDIILRLTSPRDLLSFARASSTVEKWYYSSTPQLPGLRVRSFDFTVPCCGKRDGLSVDDLFCTSCYTWRHKQCAGLKSQPIRNPYICSECIVHRSSPALTPGGIYQESRRGSKGHMSLVNVSGKDCSLQQRLGKPAHLRPKIRFMESSKVPPSLIDYAILFNGVFCGLAYGLED